MSWEAWIKDQGVTLKHYAELVKERFPRNSPEYKYALYYPNLFGVEDVQICRAFAVKAGLLEKIKSKVYIYAKSKHKLGDLLQLVILPEEMPSDRLELCLYEFCTVSRIRENVLKRQILMHYMRTKHGLTYQKIGQLFARDHGTVIHAQNSIQGFIEYKDPLVLNYIKELKDKMLEIDDIMLGKCWD